jgi:hypothetical protein
VSYHAVCFGCDAIVTDIERGWVRTHPPDSRVWFLCLACLDREPRIDWSGNEPRIAGYQCACACHCAA